ncbi:MAG: helix-turn-helix domain-containing protein [Kiritimatiellae bacterium]|nr:helix-turn-helix domain-containing protein [Kiritimatiellia bacterium]
MEKESNKKNKCWEASESVKQIRKHARLTQSAVAQALGVSIRAIQSYEQGWREVPTHIMVQLLVLAAAHHTGASERAACWDVTRCPPERQALCPCRRTDGRLCWLVSGRLCAAPSTSGPKDVQRCMECSVIKQILN